MSIPLEFMKIWQQKQILSQIHLALDLELRHLSKY